MLMLLFHAGDNLYAIDSAHVVEVIPRVVPRKLDHVPNYVAGIFNYRGSLVPIIDLCRLLHGTDCRPRFSTRVIMVHYTANDGKDHQLGLMAEQVTETLSRPDLDSKKTSQVGDLPYLGNLFMDEKGMIQQVHWQHLVSGDQSALLFIGGDDRVHGTGRN
ncbi:MAG: chemotaxis protein CheW [Phormidesmis sp. CAN_BIN36]|nr:chemotaxis protein CheW [Phormidesmis sp. CAN_BIN36]